MARRVTVLKNDNSKSLFYSKQTGVKIKPRPAQRIPVTSKKVTTKLTGKKTQEKESPKGNLFENLIKIPK